MQLSNSRLFFEIDDEDFDKVKGKLWFINKKRYIYANNNKTKVSLHRVLLGLVKNDNKIVDHKDGNTLNNTKSNLRICSSIQNSQNRIISRINTSGYKGVNFNKTKNTYVATIYSNYSRKRIGSYKNPILAAKAYDKYAEIIFGEFAKLNFPIGHENYCRNNIEEYDRDFNDIKDSIGIIFRQQYNRWEVNFCGKYLGSSESKINAMKIYNNAAINKYGDKAKINIIRNNDEYN